VSCADGDIFCKLEYDEYRVSTVTNEWLSPAGKKIVKDVRDRLIGMLIKGGF